MAFIDRFDPTNDDATMSFHELTSAVYLVSNNHFTKAQFKTAYELDSTDDAQINDMIAHYQSLSADEKKELPHVLESYGIFWSSGKINRSQFAAKFGINDS